MPSFGGKRKGALLVAGLHREHLQLPQKGVERLPCQVCEIGKIVHFGRLVISRTIQALRSFSTACWAVKPQSSSGKAGSRPKRRPRRWRRTIVSSSRASSAGDMEHLPLAGHIAEDMPAGAAEPFRVSAAGHHQVDPHPQQAKAFSKPSPAGQLLGGLEVGLAQDHRQIQIGIRAGLSLGTGAKDHHGNHIGLGAEARQGLAAGLRIQPGSQLHRLGQGPGLTPGDLRRAEGLGGGRGHGSNAIGLRGF